MNAYISIDSDGTTIYVPRLGVALGFTSEGAIVILPNEEAGPDSHPKNTIRKPGAHMRDGHISNIQANMLRATLRQLQNTKELLSKEFGLEI